MEGHVTPHAHLIANDHDLIDALCELLIQEGVTTSSSRFDEPWPRRADAVIIDALPDRALGSLIEAIMPTKTVVLCTSEPPPSDAHAALLKPFGADAFLANVAAAVGLPPNSDDRAIVAGYFAALADRRWDDFQNLCDEDVSYQLAEHAVVRGRGLFRKFTEDTFADFRDVHFEDLQVYALPRAVFATYRSTWRDAHGGAHELPGALRFTFRAGRVRTIGVDVDTERLRSLGHLVA
jgi:hypothetical protein